ncbi:hypothetical protein DNH61_03275 [Paenibacillus sambharensis]|uniref:Tetratricopeptide repeat protein n=1 Tax=Paenibacillus sambharensis TaxID=1803190 RepID=A0A2W1LQZ8_9BACL|nr:hypothetical protein [Paenibacillus sambharensis]PZD97382.1 hypothetical protein DNH61_03275 [Paenibacillus sambharensis]
MKERYEQLRSKAWSMPSGNQKLRVLEESIRLADEYMSKQQAYDARMDYTDEALMCGCGERMFISFGWCLSEFERNPGDYSSHHILWHYKWILNQVWRFTDFPLELINRMFEDFKTKCLKYDYHLGPYYKNLRAFAMARGDVSAAAEAYLEWKRARRDALSDCQACDHDALGQHHYQLGHYKRGLQKVKQIFDGKISCRSVPKNTYSNALLPLLEAGRAEQAAAISRKGLRLLAEGRGDLDYYADYLRYYAIVDLPKAKRIVERLTPYALQTREDWTRFKFLLAVRIFFSQWYRKKRRSVPAVPLHVTPEWVRDECDRLAAAFDKRNGNSHCSSLIERQLEQAQRLSKETSR